MRLLVPFYAVTLFLSAYLLFSIQPLFSKMVLPFLGGSPMVWNTAMVFFQGMLLAGYGYAYFASKIPKISIQIFIHLALFILFLSFLPFSITAADIPADFETVNPTYWQISLMFATIGAPFFILSGCAPLLQRWFSFSQHKDADNPYFLYAASNFGSMLALLSYPVVVEPMMGVYGQAEVWSWLYALLIILILISGITLLINIKNISTKQEKLVKDTKVNAPTWGLRLLWLLLAFIPSSLMLGVTTYLTTDIASVPLLWVIPLAIYVGTFIIAFAKTRPFSIESISKLHTLVLAGMCFVVMALNTEKLVAINFLFHVVMFSVITLCLHMRLADYKPHPKYLTEFYFIMSLGGVLGGIFNTLVAPFTFILPWEYTLVIIASAFIIDPKGIWDELRTKNLFKKQNPIFVLIFSTALIGSVAFIYTTNQSVMLLLFAGICLTYLTFFYNLRVFFALAITAILITFPFHREDQGDETLHMVRNFFGITKVLKKDDYFFMMNGTTLHGMQFETEEKRLHPVGYYHRETSIGEAFRYFTDQGKYRKVAVLGLGTGGVACYIMPGRTFDFYEIDPDVAELSIKHEYFTYLRDCGNPYKIILGDARLKVAEAPDAAYDFIFVDVFSSDNIPVHLMTEEAIALYLSKISEKGALLIHITNRHIDLRPVLATIAKELGIHMLYKRTVPTEKKLEEDKVFSTNSVLMARDFEIIQELTERSWKTYEGTASKYHWTDEYVNILNSLRLVRLFTSEEPIESLNTDE